MADKRHTTLNMPDDLIMKARAKALAERTNVSAVVIAFLEAWIAGKIEVPQPQQKGGKHKT